MENEAQPSKPDTRPAELPGDFGESGSAPEATESEEAPEREDRAAISPDGRAEKASESKLERCEKTIHEHLQNEIKFSRAAREIINGRLYTEKGFESLGAYTKATFGVRQNAFRKWTYYANVYDIIEENREEIAEECSLTDVRDVPLPRVKAWTRPLHKKANRGLVEEVIKIWAAVVRRHGSSITENRVEDIRDEVLGEDKDSEEDSEDSGDSEDESPEDDGGDSGSGEDSLDSNDSSPDGDTEGNGTDDSGDDDSGKGSSGGDSDEDEGDVSRLEHLRRKHPALLQDLNKGVAGGLVRIADSIAGGSSPERGDLETARSSFESLSHREALEEEEDETALPACITDEDFDAVEDREILVAVPTELVTPQMAQMAVPVGVPQMQYAVGVPLSHFDDRPPIDEILSVYEEQGRDFSFNRTNENVDWAAYTTNTLTGCLHTCAYCYARYQAEGLERYKQGFQPTFFPGRLLGFSQTEPPEKISHPRDKNVFVGSMSDIFGKWVPEWMIQRVLDEVEENDDFDHLFLTKFPQKLSQFDFPDNAWVGTTVDKTHRVSLAERCFQEVNAPVKWLSCEPLLEDVAPRFDDLSMFDCVVIGAQKGYGNEIEEDQPELEWVIKLYQKARKAGCKVYFKENLDVFPKELPEG